MKRLKIKSIAYSIIRYFAFRTPVVSKILSSRQYLIAKNQEANFKIDQLSIEYNIINNELLALKNHICEIRALTTCVSSQSREIFSLRDLISAQTSEFSHLRDIIKELRCGSTDGNQIVASVSDEHNLGIKLNNKLTINSDNYDEKLSQEFVIFSEDIDVHNLPDIFHYWSNKYLKPMIEEIGCAGVEQFYAKYLFESASNLSGPYEFVSIGSGNADVEINVAKFLIQMGLSDFSIECLEYNSSMIERGRASSINQGLEKYITFTQADFNNWEPGKKYCGIMANHSLHHVVNLEGLFDTIKNSLLPNGLFVIGDVVGRNGHQRWPEAMDLVNHFWADLGDKYKYNQQLNRLELSYVDHDCSSEGFEGIRAQDIMKHLLLRFHFKVFIGFLNVVSPFIDRSFGHNFDVADPIDCAFIDKVHQADEDGFKSGVIKPTQIFAVLSLNPVLDPFFSRGLSPEFSIRVPDP